MNINECGCRPYGWLGLDGNRCIRVIPRQKPSTATVSSDEGSDDSEAEILSSGEEQFSTLTSYDRQKQYRPPDPTKTDAKFGAKKKNALKSLEEELSKVSKKMADY